MTHKSRETHAPQEPAWHALHHDHALEHLESRAHGLTHAEARERLDRHGRNVLRPPRRRGPLLRFLIQFDNVLIYVLLVAAVVTALLQHWVDTGVILAVVLVNAIIGYVQEGKAERALEAVRDLLSHEASVTREGERQNVPAAEVVPGDIVHLESGDRVPADLRLLHSRELRIDEAMLTGESVPVDKSHEPVREEAALGDRRSMAFSGTYVTSGKGHGVAVGTGERTEIGRISELLREVQELTTPLLQQMNRFGRWLTFAILAVAGATFLLGWLRGGYTTAELFLAAVGLAVAAIPEGLPAIVTIALAIGVQAMARRQAIIRRLPAVETLGAVTVICSDKTGTLTRNEMTAVAVVTADVAYEVTGAGYAPQGGILRDGEQADLDAESALGEVLRAGLLCNEASVREGDGQWVVHGDPTEGALVTLAHKGGLDPRALRRDWRRIDAIPFESERRYAATLNESPRGGRVVYVKGAPERLLEMCARERVDGKDVPLDAAPWTERVTALAEAGNRVLALAACAAPEGREELRPEDVERDLVLLGIVGLLDPPREEAIRAVRACREAGIRVKMVTGDHALTAAAVGARLGIGDGQQALTGREIEGLDDAALAEQAAQVDIYARASPEHKLRLVQALQAQGHVVAMTGDGVNDAPALKRADVGVAMGVKGTEVARQSAEMVLADDNFASIEHAVEEGRRVYDNIVKSILFILPTNGGEALLIVLAILFGILLPMTPVQILWVNMITAVTLAVSLAFEPAERGIMARPPRAPDAPLLSRFLVWRIVFVALIIVVGVFGLFLYERASGTDLETARTVSVNALVMFEVFYLWNARYLTQPVLNREGLFGNRVVLLTIVLVIGFQLLFTYAPWMQALFRSAPLDAMAWLRIVVVASTVLWLVEIEKALLRRRTRDPHGAA